MTDITRETVYGKRPLRRISPQSGQSEWYYLDPRGASTLGSMKQIDVPSEHSPNPYANEIQNYLYKNDEYNYKQLYGDTPPPMQRQNNMQQPHKNGWDTVKNWANKFADATEAFSVAFANGMTLGNFDEMAGAAAAGLTGNRINYATGRDAVRQLSNNLNQRNPYIYNGAEFGGAMYTPMHLTKGVTYPQKAFNALTDTINASAGYAENWNDFGTNLAVNGVANYAGLKFDSLPLWRASGRPIVQLGKKVFKQGINSSADKLKNMFYSNEDE